MIEKLEGQAGQYRHATFGPKSEKLDPAQLDQALEDLETAIAETQISAVEDKITASATDPDKDAPRKARALPDHLPPVERADEPDSIACPCGCSDMVQIAIAKQSEHIPLNRQAVAMARLGVLIERSVLADLDGPHGCLDRTGCGSYGGAAEDRQLAALCPARVLLRNTLPDNGP